MDQREVEQKILPIQIIYFIESQIIDNENADKIVWNSLLIDFYQQINQIEEVEVIGLYGVKSTVLEFLEKKSQCTIEFPNNFLFYSKRGMLCLVQHEKICYLAFIGTDEYFLQDLFKESIEITLFRFLKDICSKILLLPSDQIMRNWKHIKSHFYEDNKINQVEKFKWSRDTQIKQEKKDIKINIEQSQIEELTYIKNSFENTFTSQGVKKVSQYRIEEQILRDLFLQILQEKQADKVDLTQFPFQIQNIFHDQLETLEMVINHLYLNYSNEIYFELKKGPFQLYFCDYHIIPNLLDIIIRFLWQRFGIDLINYDRNDDLYQLQKFITNQNFNKQKCIQEDLIKNLKGIVDKYLNILNNLFDQNNQQSLKNYLEKFINDVTLEAEKIDYDKDLLIEIKQYQLTPVQKDTENSDDIEIIVNQQQQEILIIDNGLTSDQVFHKICHYGKTLHQKLDMYICQLVSQNQQKYQYLWVIDDNSQYKIICQLQQSVLEQEYLFYYNSQNSKLYVFNSQIGLTIIQFSEKGKNCSEERSIQWKEQKYFKQLCYLQQFDCFILLGSDNILYKFQNDDIKFEVVNLKRDERQGFKNYNKIMSTGTGYYLCLINQEFCDFYNFNYQLVFQINFETIQFNSQDIMNDIYLLSDRSNWYSCLLNVNQQKSMMLKEFNQDKITIPKQKNVQLRKESNPFLDLLKGSIIKFGPVIKIIPQSYQQTIELYISSTLQYCDYLEKYFQIQKISLTYQLQKADIYKIRGMNIKISDLMFALISRGSMQLCTIRNSNLIPLEKGLIRPNKQGFKKVINITDKINQLSFGIFEILTTLEAQKIFIISIMGKQSLGKSYLLNRVFGTRFGVSSARCTDGIWISFCKIEDIMFVVLDCEGLLGPRRKQEEEFKLLSFITSLSDYTILNQDLNQNRNLEDLLNNLPQLRGKILFQGQLMIIYRDVSSDGREAAKNENYNFLERMKNNRGNFISNIFQDQFSVMIMNNFLENVFEQQIVELKNDFICEAKNKKRWDSVQQVIKSMKILLVQLEVNDHRTLEEIEIEHLIDTILKMSTSLWFTKLEGDFEQIDMYKEDISFSNLLDHFLPSGNISSLNHNQLLSQANLQIQEFFEKRIEVINQKLAVQFKQLKEEDQINKLKLQIINHLKNYAFKYQLCGQKCHQCYLICRLKLNHSSRAYKAQLDISKKIEDQKNYQEKLTQDLSKKGLPSQFTEEQFNKQKVILGQLQQQYDRLKEQIEYVEMTEEKQFHLDSINKILGIQLYDKQKFKNFPIYNNVD